VKRWASEELNPKVTKELEIEGRKVRRFDHSCLREWGYRETRKHYFYRVYPDKPQPHPPLLVVLHSAGGDAEMELPAYLKKPWFRELSGFYALALNCGRKNASQQDYWYGQNLIRDHREVYANRLTPVENRLLATIHWVLRQHPIDPERVYLYGASMGGSGGLGVAMPHGELFAAIYLEVPAGFDHFHERMHFTEPLAYDTNQKSERDATTPKAKASIPDPPFLVFAASHMDPWGEGVENFLRTLHQQLYAEVFAWGRWGHVANPWSFPTANPAAFEFPWQAIRKNESYPVFTDATTDDHWPGFRSTEPDQQGQINAYFRWTNVIDTPGLYAMDFRLVQDCELGRKVRIPKESTVDVTFRRLQKLDVRKGGIYHWLLEREGKLVGSGQVRADAFGLLRIPRLTFTVKPSRLTIIKSDQSP